MLTVMGSALVLVRVTPWAGEVVPMAWAGKLSALGPADRPGARCANTLNSVVCTQSGPASAGGVQAVVGSVGLGLMPGPSIRKRLSPVGLPLTPWGVTPSERKPTGGAGAVPSHCRNGSMGLPGPRGVQPPAGQGPVARAKFAGVALVAKAPESVVSLMSRPAAPSAFTVKVFWPNG